MSTIATALGISAFIIAWGLFDRRLKRKWPVPADIPGVALTFDNITYNIGQRRILHGISGIVRPGEFLAIMGPSGILQFFTIANFKGSGKTTFLDILAKKAKSGTIGGQILVDGSECPSIEQYQRITGYVDQEDIHYPELTVRETVEFSAFVRLPESISIESKKRRAQTVLEQLGLAHVADSRVGDASKRGLSGGEKKRLSIALELVTNPPVLFCDEPTSGLDSNSALQVIQTLSKLANEQHKTARHSVIH